jgi:hypothetical protein
MLKAISRNIELFVCLRSINHNSSLQSFHSSTIKSIPRAGGANENQPEINFTSLVPSPNVKAKSQKNGDQRGKFSRFDSKKSQPKRATNLFRITNLGNNTTRIFRGVPDDQNDSKNFAFKGKSTNLPDELDDEDPEKFVQYEEELDMFVRDENKYHEKIIDEDIVQRRRMKMAIIKKKIAKIEGEKYRNTNLLTWDAKEQIKYLNLNYPGSLIVKFFSKINVKI